MKIAVLGASGMAGSRIVAEALARGHQVTGIARNPERIAPRPGLTVAAGDILSPGIADLLKGHDVVVSAMHFSTMSAAPVLAAVKAAGVPRLAVVGGAGSLKDPTGKRVVDSPDFPDAWKSEALGGAAFLDALKAESGLDWTFLSPSAEFAPGPRTGRFRLGADDLLIDADGRSHISVEDYAIAFLDEIERPAHSRRRFTVGY